MLQPMHIKVDRITSTNDATLSVVYVDQKFQCFGIEDEHREEKIAGETRIPKGMYKIKIRDVGGFHSRYSKKFPKFHQGMLEIADVPNFEYVLIHIGNDEGDTAGCLLVGQNAYTAGKLKNGSSTKAYIEFYKKVINAALNERLTITYRDLDL